MLITFYVRTFFFFFFWENTGYYLLVFSVSLQCKYLLYIQVSPSHVWGKSLLASSPSPSPSFSFQTYNHIPCSCTSSQLQGNLHYKLGSAFPKKISEYDEMKKKKNSKCNNNKKIYRNYTYYLQTSFN